MKRQPPQLNKHDPEEFSDEQREFIAALARTRPQADPNFQQQLEDRLMNDRRHAMIRARSNGLAYNVPVTAPEGNKSKIQIRRFALPLTLTAAVVALVVIGGAILIFGGSGSSPQANAVPIQPDNNDNSNGLQGEATATFTATATHTLVPEIFAASPTWVPTATPFPFDPNMATPVPFDPNMMMATPTMVPFGELQPTVIPPAGAVGWTAGVVAVTRDLPRGTILTDDMLENISYSGDASGYLADINAMLGGLLTVDLRQGSFVKNSDVIRGLLSETITYAETGVATYELANFERVIVLPLNKEQVYLLQAGDHVKVQAVIQPLPEYQPLREAWEAADQNNLVTLAENATVSSIGLQAIALDQSSTIVSDTIVLKVAQEDADLIQWVQEAGFPLVYEVVFANGE